VHDFPLVKKRHALKYLNGNVDRAFYRVAYGFLVHLGVQCGSFDELHH
jgi:hypothetical protein